MHLKTKEEIEKIRQAGKILAQTAKVIIGQAAIGVSTKSLDSMAKDLIIKAGGKPAFLNYQPHGAEHPYKYSICSSVNDVIVHGTPSSYKLQDGDVLKLDFGVIYDGYHADAAWTVGIGNISEQAKKLIKITEQALFAGIKEVKQGKHLGDIGWAISNIAKRNGFSVADGLTGHGVGKELHEEPSVFNEGKKGSGPKLQTGLVIAIEPMINVGSPSIVQLKDESYGTSDESLSAHFEHTVAITDAGAEILTLI